MNPCLSATLQETDLAKRRYLLNHLVFMPGVRQSRMTARTCCRTWFGGCAYYGLSQSKASLHRACLDLPAPATLLLFGEPIARVAVVVDPMLFLQFLNVPKRCLRMRSDAIVSMQQHLLQTAIHAHALVLGQIHE